MVSFPICEHIKNDGIRCGSPALRGRSFCYFHKRWRETHSRRFLAAPPGRTRRFSTPVPLDHFAQDLARQWFWRIGKMSD
ncbi:MAG TPA: hypothetical protein VEV41_08205 [Terriglobales bacterium]|nr:hypothetical protein [Terriglobales bacterium]